MILALSFCFKWAIAIGIFSLSVYTKFNNCSCHHDNIDMISHFCDAQLGYWIIHQLSWYTTLKSNYSLESRGDRG